MTVASGIIIIAIKDSFQFWKNITKSSPIKVSPSLKILKKASASILVIWSTSKLRFEMYFPVCLLSMICVSALINDFNISIWSIFFTSSDMCIIKILAWYRAIPFVEKAIIIAIGIIIIKVLSLLRKIFSIAGSSSHAVAEVLTATNIEKKAASNIFKMYNLM